MKENRGRGNAAASAPGISLRAMGKSGDTSARGGRRKVWAELSSAVNFLWRLWGWFAKRRTVPELRLYHHTYIDTKFLQGSANIQLLLTNDGKAPGNGAVIDLGIRKPKSIYPGHGLLFSDSLGALEPIRGALPGDILRPDDPVKRHRYRLKPEIFVNPKGEPLEIAYMPVVAFGNQEPDEQFDYDIEWKISHLNIPPKMGRIIIKGEDLKKILLSNVPLSQRDIGEDSP